MGDSSYQKELGVLATFSYAYEFLKNNFKQLLIIHILSHFWLAVYLVIGTIFISVIFLQDFNLMLNWAIFLIVNMEHPVLSIVFSILLLFPLLGITRYVNRLLNLTNVESDTDEIKLDYKKYIPIFNLPFRLIVTFLTLIIIVGSLSIAIIAPTMILNNFSNQIAVLIVILFLFGVIYVSLALSLVIEIVAITNQFGYRPLVTSFLIMKGARVKFEKICILTIPSLISFAFIFFMSVLIEHYWVIIIVNAICLFFANLYIYTVYAIWFLPRYHNYIVKLEQSKDSDKDRNIID